MREWQPPSDGEKEAFSKMMKGNRIKLESGFHAACSARILLKTGAMT